FGKAGADLIPLLNGGSKGLKELTDEAERYGGVLSGGTLKAAEAFNDNMSRLQRTMAGVSAQITAGMLPALQTLSQALVDSAKSGDGFVTTGANIGEVLIDLAGFAMKSAATLQAFGLVVGGLAAAATAPPGQVKTIIGLMIDDVNALEKATNEKLSKMSADLARFKADAAKTVETPGPGKNGVADALRAAELAEKARKDAAAAATAQRKAEKLLSDERERQDRIRAAAAKALVQISKDEQQVLQDLADQQVRNTKAAEDAAKANQAFIDALDPAGAALETYFAGMAKLQELQEASVITVERRIALEKVLAENLHKSGDAATKQVTALSIVGDGFESFFTNLSKGSADASDAFKRMAQSILADLLRLLAKKVILKAFGFDIGGPGSPTFDSFAMPSFATPSAIVGPSAFATSTSTGAAISPLRFGGSGNLSLPAQQQQAMQVTINNNAAGVQVETRQTPGGLEVNIDQIRAALSADILRGGNIMAHAAERAWGLSRGNAAAF
ncbi:MAG TPA: hypothetical protein VN755_09260, partial [Steroidobacteraceae bacterium]|nr:hypothetical protein [Steroidobacteraceae bacterium]